MSKRRTDIDEAKDAIIAAYNAGTTCQSIAETYHCKKATIVSRISEWDVSGKKKSWRRNTKLDDDKSTIIKLYARGKGKSCQEIADIYNVTAPTVRSRLQDWCVFRARRSTAGVQKVKVKKITSGSERIVLLEKHGTKDTIYRKELPLSNYYKFIWSLTARQVKSIETFLEGDS